MSTRFNPTGILFGVLLSLALIPAAAQMSSRRSIGSKDYDAAAAKQAQQYLEEGRKTFRFDTFGSEDFWGGTLKLHEAIAGEKLGGIGPGLSPQNALELEPHLVSRDGIVCRYFARHLHYVEYYVWVFPRLRGKSRG